MLTEQILLQLAVILILVQLFGYMCGRIGQQWVIGEILAGLVLGPSLLGAFWPALKGALFPAASLPTLQTLGDIGLALYMFSLGARLDINLMLHRRRTTIVMSLSSILLPLSLGAVIGFFLYPGFAGPKANLVSFMFLVGTSMAITAFPVLARLLSEKQMLGTRVGMLALTSAAAGDVVAWFLLALVVATIHTQNTLSAVLTIVLTLVFIAVMLGVVRPLFVFADRRIQSKQMLVALSLLILLLSALLTNTLGIHPVFGAFLAGIILPRKATFIAYMRSIDQVNNVLFLPLYFVYSGLRTQVGLISAPGLWLICLLVLAVACLGKILGAMLSARWMGEGWGEALSLGVLMNTRGLVELIVLNIGLDAGILSRTLFAMLVIMALVTTMMASPLLSLLGYQQANRQYIQSDLQEAGQEPIVPG